MIVTNKIQCARCKSIIESCHDYDFVQCSCKAVGVEGGLSYLRRIGEAEDIVELSEVREDVASALTIDELAVFASLERKRTPLSLLDSHNLLAEGSTSLHSLANLIETTLTAAARSTATRRTYQTAIGLFLQFLDQKQGDQIPEKYQPWRPFATATTVNGKTVWEIRASAVVLQLVTPTVLEGFRHWRESTGDSPNTASTRVYAIRTFLSVAQREGVLTPQQIQSLGLKGYSQRQKRVQQPVGRRLTRNEVQQLRAAVDAQSNKGKRDLAILDVMLFAGLRREEVAELDRSALRQDGGRWWLVFSGKGEKMRRLKVHDTLYQSLQTWLTTAGIAKETKGPMFRSFDRGDHVTEKSIDPSTVGRIVTEYGHLTGIADQRGRNQLSAHDLRRTCARNAYDNGASLLLVQAMLGHEDPKTTAHYIGAFESDDDTAIDYVRY